MGARKKYARRIIGLKLLHIRKCASETRYSAIFKSCFPPHNAEFDECVGGEGRGGGVYIVSRHRARNLRSAAEILQPPRLSVSARRRFSLIGPRVILASPPLCSTSNEIVRTLRTFPRRFRVDFLSRHSILCS